MHLPISDEAISSKRYSTPKESRAKSGQVRARGCVFRFARKKKGGNRAKRRPARGRGWQSNGRERKGTERQRGKRRVGDGALAEFAERRAHRGKNGTSRSVRIICEAQRGLMPVFSGRRGNREEARRRGEVRNRGEDGEGRRMGAGGSTPEEKEARYILYDSVIAFPRTNIALAEQAQENVGVNRSSPFCFSSILLPSSPPPAPPTPPVLCVLYPRGAVPGFLSPN